MSNPLTPRRASLLAFLTAFSTLFAQILIHRVISAKLLNNFAFLVIALTMLGFAASGVILSRVLPAVSRRLADVSAACAGLFAAGMVVVLSIFYHLDAGPQTVSERPAFVLALLHWIPVSLLFAIPFAFAGFILGALLADPKLPTRKIYFADLVGSALGALLVVPAIRLVGVETSMLACCFLFVAATAVLTVPRTTAARILLAAGALATAVGGAASGRVFQMRYPEGSMLSSTTGERPAWKLEHVAWDALARIEVSRLLVPVRPEGFAFPAMLGNDRAFHARYRRILTQNNFAFTYALDYDGDPRSLSGIKQTTYWTTYAASSVPHPKVAVIGVGGGFDVLAALAADASSVTAIEVNSATVEILRHTYRDYFRRWVEDPRVNLVNAEGRHQLSSSPERYDVLQLSGVDSYSGTPGAAHVFSESYLYTEEAFDLYLSRLTDRGILTVGRLDYPVAPREVLKLLVLAVGALRRAGVSDPAAHIMMAGQRDATIINLLVKRTPFSVEEQRQLAAWTATSPYIGVIAAPGLNAAQSNTYQEFLALNDPRHEAQFVRQYPFDIAGPSDDRPFFFRHSFWWHVFPTSGDIWAFSLPAVEYSLLLLAVFVSVAALLTIYLPLRFFLAHGAATPHAFRQTVFFAGTGIGYMAIEIALLQKFGLFLGHPNYAISVVLMALLFSTGLGSLWSNTILRTLPRLRFVSYVLAAVVLLEHLLVFPHLRSWIAWPFALRAAIAMGLIAPFGICLGVFLPTALERLKAASPAFVPWAWGINGIFSVLAPIVAIAVSMTWGISALLLASVPVYLIVGLVFPDSAAGPLEKTATDGVVLSR